MEEKFIKYIEALDTLIFFYREKIDALEKMKLEFIHFEAEKKDDTPKPVRQVVNTQEQYDIIRGCTVRRIKYDDGSYEDILLD